MFSNIFVIGHSPFLKGNIAVVISKNDAIIGCRNITCIFPIETKHTYFTKTKPQLTQLKVTYFFEVVGKFNNLFTLPQKNNPRNMSILFQSIDLEINWTDNAR